MVSSDGSNTAVVATAKQFIAGTAKHLSGATSVAFFGGSYTATDLTTKLQLVVSAQSDVDAANATAKAKLAARQTVMASGRPFIGALRAYIKAVYGNQPDVLADFGIHPKTRVAPTAVTVATAVVKREAARAARGTKGSKQKKAIKGDVTGITLTPTTATSTALPATTSNPSVGAPSPAPTASPTPHATTPAT